MLLTGTALNTSAEEWSSGSALSLRNQAMDHLTGAAAAAAQAVVAAAAAAVGLGMDQVGAGVSGEGSSSSTV